MWARGANLDDIVNSDHYTDVKQAVEFVKCTGCGSLAVAVGNAHGAYVQTPNLDFDRIASLRSSSAHSAGTAWVFGYSSRAVAESVRLGRASST